MKTKVNKAAIKRGQEEQERLAKEGEERTKKVGKRLEEFRKKDAKRNKTRSKTDEDAGLVGTSGEGGQFKLIGGMHVDQETGIHYGKHEEGGEFVDSDLPLDELFDNKFIRVGGGTLLGRDRRRDKIDSNVMDRPQVWEEDEKEENVETEIEEEEEDAKTSRIKSRKAEMAAARMRTAAKAGRHEDPAQSAEEEEEEPPKKSKKGKKSRFRE